MTGNELIELFRTEEFRAELVLMSSALASITHEGPIKHAVAKLLYRVTRDYALEDKHRDLLIQGTHVEFKFNFDRSAASIEKDMNRWATLQEMWAGYKSKSRNWSPFAKLYEDIAGRNNMKPDVFVWIVCSRDLEGMEEAELKQRRVCMWREQRKYNENHKYTEGYHRAVNRRLIDLIKKDRPCDVLHETSVVRPVDDFESTYDFYVFQFER